MRALSTAPLLVLLLASCGGDEGVRLPGGGKADDPTTRPEPARDWSRDLLSTSIVADVSTATASATIAVAASDSRGLSLEVGDLEIHGIRDEFGDLLFTREGATLDIGLPATGSNNIIVIDYGYTKRTSFEGALESGITLTWPYHCGNLFPCKSDPADGLELALQLRGTEPNLTAVYPDTIPADAPSYMLAWAIGEYSYEELGVTDAGTEVGVYYLPGGETKALAGTENLPAIFQWLETTLGPYSFGTKAASVAAPWGAGQFGGMEHHPLWHVGIAAMADEETHAHEAAHGWYGNGVRIECWEDFVLSEGTVSYLTARSIEQAVGKASADAVWAGYRARLSGVADLVAWPESCGVIDIIEDGLFSSAPYMKGAFFFKSLAATVGKNELDGVLSRFYAEHVGGAATFQDLLDAIEADTGYAPSACAEAWLRSDIVPDSEVCE